MFTPTKQAAHNSLQRFIPKCGSIYTAYRNYDREDKSNSTVSRISPWIRNRTLPEWEVIDAVLKEHSTTTASKFVDEVLWRTYWKGWLQLRPSVWKTYQQDITKLYELYSNNSEYTKAIDITKEGLNMYNSLGLEDDLNAISYLARSQNTRWRPLFTSG